MPENSVKISAWKEVVGPRVLTEGGLAVYSRFWLVKRAVVKGLKTINCRASFTENLTL